MVGEEGEEGEEAGRREFGSVASSPNLTNFFNFQFLLLLLLFDFISFDFLVILGSLLKVTAKIGLSILHFLTLISNQSSKKLKIGDPFLHSGCDWPIYCIFAAEYSRHLVIYRQKLADISRNGPKWAEIGLISPPFWINRRLM